MSDLIVKLNNLKEYIDTFLENECKLKMTKTEDLFSLTIKIVSNCCEQQIWFIIQKNDVLKSFKEYVTVISNAIQYDLDVVFDYKIEYSKWLALSAGTEIKLQLDDVSTLINDIKEDIANALRNKCFFYY